MADDRKQRVAGFFNRSAAAYDTVIPFFATFGQKLVEAACLAEGERVLDLACGRAACLRPAATAVGVTGRVVGVDLSESMVRTTEAELRSAGIGNASVRVGDAECLDLESHSFDAVLCGFGVFFFPDPARALGECLRVLRPGGRFAASTFATGRGGYPWADEVARELGKDAQMPESPVRMAAGLRALLGAAGFEKAASTTVEARFFFRDIDAYVDWNWSHGGRRLLEQLSKDELARFREAAARHLAAHAVDGGFELVQGVELTVAQRP